MRLLPDQITHPDEGNPQNIGYLGYVPGVYFLMDGERDVLYIGQSRCVAGRFVQHFQAGIIPFSKVAWIEVEISRLVSTELRLIQKYQPHFNDVEFRRAHLAEMAGREF